MFFIGSRPPCDFGLCWSYVSLPICSVTSILRKFVCMTFRRPSPSFVARHVLRVSTILAKTKSSRARERKEVYLSFCSHSFYGTFGKHKVPAHFSSVFQLYEPVMQFQLKPSFLDEYDHNLPTSRKRNPCCVSLRILASRGKALKIQPDPLFDYQEN